jgi:hypothetical protein
MVQAKTPDFAADPLHDPHRTGIVRPGNHPLRSLGKLHKGRFHRRDRAVGIKVIGLNVRYHRDGGMKLEERLIILVCFDDIETGAPDPDISAPRADPTACNPGRIEVRRT